MALFTDGSPATIDDLKRYDSAAEGLSRDAGVDLDAKLTVAAEEVGQELFEFLLFLCPAQGTTASPFLNVPPAEAARHKIGLADVVVNDPLRRWHAMRTLAGLYRDVYCSDVNDRYRQKWESYEELARKAGEYAFSTGIGICRNPVPKAPTALVAQAGGAATRIDCAVHITWVKASGEEGAPSDAWKASLGPGDLITAALPAPSAVCGWNVYIGMDQGVPLKQNDTTLPLDAMWVLPPETLRAGAPVSEGQVADILVVERRIIPRG